MFTEHIFSHRHGPRHWSAVMTRNRQQWRHPLPKLPDQTLYPIAVAIPVLNSWLRINSHLWFKFSSFDFLSAPLEEDNIIPTGSLEFPVPIAIWLQRTVLRKQKSYEWSFFPFLPLLPPLPPNRSSCFLLQNRLTRCWSGARSLGRYLWWGPEVRGGCLWWVSGPVISPILHPQTWLLSVQRGWFLAWGPLFAESISHLSGLIHSLFFHSSWELGSEANIQPSSGRELGSWTLNDATKFWLDTHIFCEIFF